MAFASTSDVINVLGETPSAGELNRIQVLLDDATDFLEGVIGQRLDAATLTMVQRIDTRTPVVELPEGIVRDVTAVSVNGDALDADDWEWFERQVRILSGLPSDRYATVAVTYECGLTTAPPELRRLTRNLAIEAWRQLSRTGTVGPGAVQSERIDDYAVTYRSDGSPDFDLPAHLVERLRARYGANAYVVGQS